MPPSHGTVRSSAEQMCIRDSTTVYQQFEGVTWYIQKVLNTLYDMTPEHGVCKVEMVSEAIRQIIDSGFVKEIFRNYRTLL